MEELKNKMIHKWISIPYSILVVVVAGACYNLFAYFQSIAIMKGYSQDTLTGIQYTVLLGYYLGIIPGYINRNQGTTIAFYIAAALSLISFAVLGYIANSMESSMVDKVLMFIFLFIGAMSGSIATIAAIVTTVKSFPKMAGILIIVILVSYYKIAPYFEYSVRVGFFTSPNLQYYFAGVGAIQAVIYVIASFAIQEIDLGGNIEKALQAYDRMGLLSYVLIEVILFLAFFIFGLVYENWKIAAIIFIFFLVLNFIAVAGAFTIVYQQAKTEGLKVSASINREKRRDIPFEEMLHAPKYICLTIASFFILGTTCTFSFNIFQISFSFHQLEQGDLLLDSFWGADMFGRIGGGLVAYFFIDKINGYKWAIFASIISALGFAVCLLTESVSPHCLFISTIMVGFASGLFWVMVPSVVMEDAGEINFGLNWGLTLLASAVGMVIFGVIFDQLYSFEAGGGTMCSGINCVMIPFILFCILGVVSAGLCYYALIDDEKPEEKERTLLGMKY
uniref:Uncharacterized protein n=1 Tax=Euplotes crassus TaxID=5936 RepID=A0A7S3NT38_EUPCR